MYVSNDEGGFFVPNFGVNTLSNLQPGKAYNIFINGGEEIEFSWPESNLNRVVENMQMDNEPEHYSVFKTGVAYPIIIQQLFGDYNVGDEIAAYDNGKIVGAVKIVDKFSPIVVPAWQSFDKFGINLPGYEIGRPIELRLWSHQDNEEQLINLNFNNNLYGMDILSSGTATVYDMPYTPTSFVLMPAYPNPFNPITNIQYGVPKESFVSIQVYDINGKLIDSLVDSFQSTGYHTITWDASKQSTGLYFIKFKVENNTQIQKVFLVK